MAAEERVPVQRWRVESETGRLTDVLLCRPDFYDWQPTNVIAQRTLASGQGFDRQALARQYDEMIDALRGAGVTCHFLEPEPHLPYQVYTRDSSQVTPWGPVVMQMFRPQRRGEYASVIRFYAGHDGVHDYATDGTVEGGDIQIIRPGLLIVGHSGERTNEAGARQFARRFRDAGWTVRLEPFPEHFLHFDVMFAMVADGLALACTEVLPVDFLDFVRAQGIRLLPVSYKEAMDGMGCNVLALGEGRVISPRHGARVNAMLRAEGLSVLDPELDIFTRGGGSVHCMTMPLRREGV